MNPATARRLTATVAALGTLAEQVAAGLVAVEIALLLCGVAARYLFHAPLVWSDELAGILFQWLAMLGAVAALRRGMHMRMTALADRAPPPWWARLEALARLAAVIFPALLLAPAVDYAAEAADIATPALDISGAWAAAAFPIGTALMLLVALARALEAGMRAMLAAGAAAGVLGLAFVLAAPLWQMLGAVNLVVFFGGLAGGLVAAGVPIAFAFGLASFAYLGLVAPVPESVLVGRMAEGMSQLVLLAVPLFVVLGLMMDMTGLARALVRFLVRLLGGVRGGLAYVLIGAMYLVSGISGSKAADMAAVAPALLPELRRAGADPGELVALLAATGAQTETVPPSLVLITVGSVTGVSIAALFTGGVLPGLVLGLGLCLVVWRRGGGGVPALARRRRRQDVAKAFLFALPGLALPFVIRGAVIRGAATATEVSTVGIVYVAVAGLVFYRRFDWRRLGPILTETAALAGAILFIIGAATGMSWALTQSGFAQALARAMAALPGGRAGFLAVSIAAFIVLGSVLEGIPAVVLFGPLLFPIARGLGLNDVHYAIVVVLAMGLGLFAPPFGVGYYAACAIARVPPAAGIRPLARYLVTLLIGLLLLAAVPWFSVGFL